MKNCLAGWKTNLVSFTGRLVLTQATISTIPNYTMQCIALPAKVTRCVDRLCRNFLWGLVDNKRKLYLVSWKKITKSKQDGGLGLQATKEKNIALLTKLNWRFHQEKDSLWARVLSNKYARHSRQSLTNCRTCSTIWIGLKKRELIFKKSTKWIVGRTGTLSFWYDKWLNEGPFRCLIAGPLTRREEGLLLMDIASSCPLCNDTSETILHILRDCPTTRRFWNSFPFSIHANLFYGSNLSSWLWINCRS